MASRVILKFYSSEYGTELKMLTKVATKISSFTVVGGVNHTSSLFDKTHWPEIYQELLLH